MNNQTPLGGTSACVASPCPGGEFEKWRKCIDVLSVNTPDQCPKGTPIRHMANLIAAVGLVDAVAALQPQ